MTLSGVFYRKELRRMAKKTKEQIRYNMQRVKNKDSQIELTLRKELWKRGLRYRKNVNRIYGKPDIAFIGKRIAIFVDSEFWHGFNWEIKKNEIKSNKEFWINKIERNMERDAEVNEYLSQTGWIVLRFWGNDIKKNVSACADKIEVVFKER